MVCKVNLYKSYDQLSMHNEPIGQIIVEKKDGTVKELFTNSKIKAYLTADQQDEYGRKIVLPHYDDQKAINEEIDENGYSLFVVAEDINEQNQATREDLEYVFEYPERYLYHRIAKQKQEKVKVKKIHRRGGTCEK